MRMTDMERTVTKIMATEHIPQIDRALKEWEESFRKTIEDINKKGEDGGRYE